MPGFARVLLRLFAIQAAWSYERMQGVGFGFAAEAALRRLDGGPGGERYRAALARQTAFFNAHPYLAGMAVGAAVRAEFEGEPPERIAKLRAALCGPLGSLGDRLFWASWLPVCAAVGILLVAFGLHGWAAFGFLALYNAPHVAARVWALRTGWERGTMVALALTSPVLQLASRLAAPVAGLVTGVMLPFAFGWQVSGAPLWVAGAAGLGAVLMALALRAGAARAGAAAVGAAVGAVTWVLGVVAP